MKFICIRKSFDEAGNHKEKPCEEAVTGIVTKYLPRTLPKEELQKKRPDEDCSQYIDYIDDDGIKRCKTPSPENCYLIEISSLEQLMDFINKYGQILIRPVGCTANCELEADLPAIEIFDVDYEVELDTDEDEN